MRIDLEMLRRKKGVRRRFFTWRAYTMMGRAIIILAIFSAIAWAVPIVIGMYQIHQAGGYYTVEGWKSTR